MATTKRQDKILATIERLNACKAKFESGAYNKKYEKMFGDDDTVINTVPCLSMTSTIIMNSPMKSARVGSLGLIWTTVS